MARTGYCERWPAANGPQYDGFTFADGRLYWIETQIEPGGYTRSRRGVPTSPERARPWASPQQVVADMGYVVVYDSAFDLLVADGVVSWVYAEGIEPAPARCCDRCPSTAGR